MCRRWLTAATSVERTSGLSILLPLLEQDPDCIEQFIDVGGSVKALLSCLRLCMAEVEDELYSATLTTEAIKRLSVSSRFIAGLFAQVRWVYCVCMCVCLCWLVPWDERGVYLPCGFPSLRALRISSGQSRFG